ncbi:MAG: hypothetical protein HQ498_01285 [Pseudohongiella sp.]|nr:hypothetical protein [Pseudohongiella sp.]
MANPYTLARLVVPFASTLMLTLVSSASFAADADIPRTPWGKPDLNGYWDYHHLTPLQRPSQFEGIEVLDETMAKDWEDNAYNRVADQRGRNSSNDNVNYVGVDLWHEEALGEWELDDHRTALITDPKNGRLPPMLECRIAERRAVPRYRGFARGPEDRSMMERCIFAPASVPPIETLIENAMLQVLLTEDYVVIQTERMHDSRIIALDNRAPLPAHVKQYYGSSRGYWDGDTLVIETTNIDESYSYQGSSPDMKVIEHLSLGTDGRIHYQYTIDDPRSWEKPWTAGYHWKPSEGPIFEYACHEWNYGLTGILQGMRVAEQDAKAKPSEENYK